MERIRAILRNRGSKESEEKSQKVVYSLAGNVCGPGDRADHHSIWIGRDSMNGKRDPRKPDWWFWIYDWSNAVKKRTGWSDEKLADAIGVSVRTLNHMKKEAYTGRMGATLRLLALYQDVTKGGK